VLFPMGPSILSHVKTVLLVPVMLLLSQPCSAQEAFRTWKMNPARPEAGGLPESRYGPNRAAPQRRSLHRRAIHSTAVAERPRTHLGRDGKPAERPWHGAAAGTRETAVAEALDRSH
jgi:hypothetical protein